MNNGSDDNGKMGVAKALSIFMQLGITMFITIFVSLIIGQFLDSVLSTGNKMTLIFLLFGLFAALKNMIRLVKGTIK